MAQLGQQVGGLPSSVVPLAVSNLADLTGGVLVNEKLMERADLRVKYAHDQPSPGAKAGLIMAAFMKDSVCVVREGIRVSNGAMSSSQALQAIEEAKTLIVNLNATDTTVRVELVNDDAGRFEELPA